MNGQEHTPDTHPDEYAKLEMSVDDWTTERDRERNKAFREGVEFANGYTLIVAVFFCFCGWALGFSVNMDLYCKKINF